MASASSKSNSQIKKGSPPPRTWNYKSKQIKKGDKDWNKYITNTSTLVKNAQISPKNRYAAGITSKVNNAIHFYLNDSIGTNGYNRNTVKYFDRLYSVHPNFEMTNTCTYVFFVRPDLNILDKNKNTLLSLSLGRSRMAQNSSPSRDQFFRYMNKTYPHVLGQLTGSRITGHDFMPMLTGRVESINLPDYKIKDYKLTQPFSGYNMPYASHALESMTGGEFEVTFRDSAELIVLKLFQTWLYYINGVTRNMFSPKEVYIRNNRADYCTSVYVITCKPDASEIIHWVKYTGAFPTSAPHSSQSFNLRGSANNKISVPFAYFHQEPLNPLSLIDFNKNAHITKDASKVAYIPLYDKTTLGGIGMTDKRNAYQKKYTQKNIKFEPNAPVALGTGNGLVKCPFICKVDNKYYLRWKKADITPIGWGN